MANGVLCKKCGWQETEHDFMDKARDPYISSTDKKSAKESLPDGYNKVQSGYRASLKGCKRYVPEKNGSEE
jgi:hypothetical protein